MGLTGLRIIWNCGSILAGNFLNKIISIVVLVILTSYLGPSEFGRYSFVISYISFFGIFTDLGINMLVSREISGGRINGAEGFGAAIMLRAFLSIATLAVSVLFLVLLGYPASTIALAGAASISLFLSFRGLYFRTVFDIPFIVSLKMSYPSAVNFLSELFTLAVIAVMVYFRATLFELVLAISLASFPGFLAAAFFAWRHIRPSFRAGAGVWKKIMKESLPLGLASLLEGLFIIIPVFLLSRLSTDEALGLYSLPFRLTASLWIIPVALMLTMFPKMSSDADINASAIGKGFYSGFKTMLIAGFCIGLVTAEYSGEIIGSLARGDGFFGSSSSLKIMIWGGALYFLNTVFFYTFTAGGKQRLNTASWAVMVSACLISASLLIPAHAHLGASLSFVIALGAGFVFNAVAAFLAFEINILPVLMRFSVCCLVPGAVFFLPVGRHLQVAASLVSFAMLLGATRTVSLREWKEWINRKNGARIDVVERAGR